MTDFEEFEGGMAVAKAPEEEAEAQAAAGEKPVVEVEAEPVDSGIEMEWEVETVPPEEPEEPEMETVTEEVVEEYYEPGYRQSYGPGYGQGYGQNRRAARRYNKHVFTWLLSFVFGIYGADRFARGQIGLGLLKLLTFGGFGFWYLYDAAVAIILSYGGAYKYNDEVTFDQYGQYML